MSRTKVSLSHLQLVEFEGRLAQKLRFHIFTCWNLKDISHKASFSQLLEVEGSLPRHAFLRVRGCTNCFVLQRTGAEHARFCPDHSRIRPAVALPVQASLSQFQPSKIEGGLAGKFRFHTFNWWNLKDVSHKSFVFTSSTVGI